jgi:hypothetical protein
MRHSTEVRFIHQHEGIGVSTMISPATAAALDGPVMAVLPTDSARPRHEHLRRSYSMTPPGKDLSARKSLSLHWQVSALAIVTATMVLVVTICTVMSLTCIFATLSMVFSICEWGCSSLGMSMLEACCRRSPSPIWRGCGCKRFACSC